MDFWLVAWAHRMWVSLAGGIKERRTGPRPSHRSRKVRAARSIRALLATEILIVGSLSCRRANDPRPIPPAIAYQSYLRAGGLDPPAGKLANPLTGNPQLTRNGEQLFSAMNCDGCHGAGALGWVGPSLVDGRWRYGGTDGEVYQSIFYGRPRGMPAYGGVLSSDAIWRIVSYLRAQPIPTDVPTQSWIATTPARPAPAREQTHNRK